MANVKVKRLAKGNDYQKPLVSKFGEIEDVLASNLEPKIQSACLELKIRREAHLELRKSEGE